MDNLWLYKAGALAVCMHWQSACIVTRLRSPTSFICMHVSVCHDLALQVPMTVAAATVEDVVVLNFTDGIVMFAIFET